LLVLTYLGGFLDQVLPSADLAANTEPAASSDSFFADTASLNTFLATIALILGAGVVFVRRLARKPEGDLAGSIKLPDTELSRRLAKGYKLVLGDDKLILTPLPK
jgi:uncharacterized membrane protein